MNPSPSPCNGEQPPLTVRLFRWTDDHTQCLQFGSNVEITYLGWYLWPDGTSLNDNVRRATGNLWGYPGKTQRVTLWSEWMMGGTTASHQVTYTGQPGQGYNVWLYNPGNFSFGASSFRYEVW